ncbi:hypothetical protein JYU14_05460, partial [Simkania negevensis]|nr:hypothetical protein [Simkania negevensis]
MPRWIRWSVRVLVLPFVWLDFACQRLVKLFMRPPNRRGGACKKRGNCCHYIVVEWIPEGDKLSWESRLKLWWDTQINGFYFRNFDQIEDDGQIVRVLSCRYLQKDGSCKHYWARPSLCRSWPRIEYFGKPRILKGCGFAAVPRKEYKQHKKEEKAGKNKLNILP